MSTGRAPKLSAEAELDRVLGQQRTAEQAVYYLMAQAHAKGDRRSPKFSWLARRVGCSLGAASKYARKYLAEHPGAMPETAKYQRKPDSVNQLNHK